MDRVGDGRVLDGSGRAAEVFWMVCVGLLSKGGGEDNGLGWVGEGVGCVRE